MSGWMALYQFMKAKERELEDRREQREKRLSRRRGRRAEGQKLRRIRLTKEEKRKLRVKILEQRGQIQNRESERKNP
jgi:hypothetical protein